MADDQSEEMVQQLSNSFRQAQTQVSPYKKNTRVGRNRNNKTIQYGEDELDNILSDRLEDAIEVMPSKKSKKKKVQRFMMPTRSSANKTDLISASFTVDNKYKQMDNIYQTIDGLLKQNL